MARSKDISSLYNFVSCTPGATIFPATRAVIATAGGTITGTDATGAGFTSLPVQAGVNPFQVTSITSATATGLFLGY